MLYVVLIDPGGMPIIGERLAPYAPLILGRKDVDYDVCKPH